jgi:hypothetical protein
MQIINGFDTGRVLQSDHSRADTMKHFTVYEDAFVSIHFLTGFKYFGNDCQIFYLEENSSFYAPEQHSLIPLNLAYSFAILWK